MKAGWLAMLLAVTVAACGSVQFGRDFDLKTFESKVERGATTQAQVRGWLGAPASTGLVVDTAGERFDEWTYYFGSGSLPNMKDAELKTLQIKFDRNGVVRGYNWSAGQR
jgi:outer membrane protein assembly factor BamE (lipoprotein component of BamABCDE complex)